MSEKHTSGPLTVKVSNEWPFNIETFDTAGKVVFSVRLPCCSTKDRSAEDAINCRHFNADKREQSSEFNKAAIANEVLRAAAPELLAALEEATDLMGRADLATLSHLPKYSALIAKVKGGAA